MSDSLQLYLHRMHVLYDTSPPDPQATTQTQPISGPPSLANLHRNPQPASRRHLCLNHPLPPAHLYPHAVPPFPFPLTVSRPRLSLTPSHLSAPGCASSGSPAARPSVVRCTRPPLVKLGTRGLPEERADGAVRGASVGAQRRCWGFRPMWCDKIRYWKYEAAWFPGYRTMNSGEMQVLTVCCIVSR
jgi:hypothetical protein